ncbi:DEAD/DEAH box helicase [Xanthocytophaga flava]|uniref:DEAD/DEAH box helicase n=1 Tax=Xanthocytophaga flava TaxID=3048013 RepID=UPI0028D314F7|nr:DEAD/DEAH box helicase family protein [Xanthocytophaga flavus]MDJ1470263.1 DEAD/DEAH box helicase family protein [Xanthocytophaga flavus]
MSYFSDSYPHLRYPKSAEGQEGLRKSQLGALNAIGAHFSLHQRPAVVVLPTGAGKTAVLMLTPYILEAERALVITPSRFVREQIKLDYAFLKTLKLAQTLPQDFETPSVYENTGMILAPETWEALRQYDVVVSTPNSASPAQRDIPEPPDDLFDLILIDEAHHSPAPTWNALIEAFPKAKIVLFTATPFRRDGREIKGKYIYTYPIQRAFEDGIYGEMQYVPVDVEENESPDVALAKKTDQVFKKDCEDGFSHIVMVRASTRKQANKLAEIYQQNTQLRLEVVHSGMGQRFTGKVVAKLRKGDLDGVICVNMLGEGFDLPRLKIAALHAPHRSLSVTLQFLGRFARVNEDRLGDAKIIAVQREIEADLETVFQANDAWSRMVRTMGQDRISREMDTREFLDDFEVNTSINDESTLEDLSLYGFNLFNHVKIYHLHGTIDLHKVPELKGFIVERIWVNNAQATVAFIARQEILPKWANAGVLSSVEHHMFVIYHDAQAGLLFMCATCREDMIYKQLADTFVDGHVSGLSLSRVNRILRSFSSLELFNVGMRNRASGTVAASYRQIAGSAAHYAIDKSDGTLYHRGHVFGRGHTLRGQTTIGLSSLSKVWRLESCKLPQLIEWCRNLSRDIENSAPFTTGIPIDHLDAGIEITELPETALLGAGWQDSFYVKTPTLLLPGMDEPISILEVDLVTSQTATTYQILLKTADQQTQLRFELTPFPSVNYVDDSQPRWLVEKGGRQYDLIKYLSEYPFRFYLADGSLLEGCQLFKAPEETLSAFDSAELMEAVDWQLSQVDPRKEFGACAPPLRSVHDWLAERLENQNPEIIFYDHRPGECADYLIVELDAQGSILVSLYHCKKAGGDPSGERDEDLFDVCGQVAKSARWRNKKSLLKQVKDRYKTGSIFLKGDTKTFIDLMESVPHYEIPLQIYIVQPGLSISMLSAKSSNLLATTSQGLVANGCRKLKVICVA